MKAFILILLLMVHSVCNATELILWRENSDTITLDRYYLQKIFSKKIARWPNGMSIQVFTKPLHSIEHRDFVVNILGLSPFYYEQQLESQTYAGKTASVVEVPNDGIMIMRVEQTPGAIGYINYDVYIGSKKVIVVDDTSIPK